MLPELRWHGPSVLPQTGERTARRKEGRGVQERVGRSRHREAGLRSGHGGGRRAWPRAATRTDRRPEQGVLRSLANGHLASTLGRLRCGGRPFPDAEGRAFRRSDERLLRSLVGHLVLRSGGGLAPRTHSSTSSCGCALLRLLTACERPRSGTRTLASDRPPKAYDALLPPASPAERFRDLTILRHSIPQEFLGPSLAVSHQLAYERRAAVQLGREIQGPGHPDPPDLDGPVLPVLLALFTANVEPPVLWADFLTAEPLYKLVDLLYEVDLLVERDVAGELVAPVQYVRHRPGFFVALFRVDLDHPYLVGSCFGELAYGRVLGEQAVPVHASVGVHGLEQGRQRGGGEDHLGRDLIPAAVEGLELAREDVDGADEEHRARTVQEALDLLELDALLQHLPQPVLGPVRGLRAVRADGG